MLANAPKRSVPIHEMQKPFTRQRKKTPHQDRRPHHANRSPSDSPRISGKNSARRELMSHVQKQLLASGKSLPVSSIVRWIGLPRSTAYYQPRQRRAKPVGPPIWPSSTAGAMVGVSLCPSLTAAPVRSSAMQSSGRAEPKPPSAPWKMRCSRALARCAAHLPTCCFVMTMAWSSDRANIVPWSATTDSNRNTSPHTLRSKTACASV